MLGLAAKCLARKRRRIGDGNRLSAAKRTDKFTVQNVTERSVADGIGGHWCLLYTQRVTSYTYSTSSFDTKALKTARRVPADGSQGEIDGNYRDELMFKIDKAFDQKTLERLRKRRAIMQSNAVKPLAIPPHGPERNHP